MLRVARSHSGPEALPPPAADGHECGQDDAPPGDRVWGAAYHIPSAHAAAARATLDLRETNGYSVHVAAFAPADSSSSSGGDGSAAFACLVYVGLPTNPQFVGPQDGDALAAHVLRCRGPSGDNRDYLFRLEAALDALAPDSGDAHVRRLAARVRELERRAREPLVAADGRTGRAADPIEEAEN